MTDHEAMERDRKDAERYRWLRDNDGASGYVSIFFYSPKYPNTERMTAEEIDAVIDAEMDDDKKTKGEFNV